MSRFVALFRGINVGRAKRVPMATLRETLAALGYWSVHTLLNSGNAVFDAKGADVATHARRIRAAVAEAVGVDAPVVVVKGADFAAAVDGNPLREVADDPSRLLLAFCPERAALAELAALSDRDWGPETLAVGEHAAYLWCPNGILKGRLAPTVDRTLGERVTTRNWATAGKIAALLTVAAG